MPTTSRLPFLPITQGVSTLDVLVGRNRRTVDVLLRGSYRHIGRRVGSFVEASARQKNRSVGLVVGDNRSLGTVYVRDSMPFMLHGTAFTVKGRGNLSRSCLG